jgi:hypothetical protein
VLGDFKCTRRTPTSSGVLNIRFRNSSRELLSSPHDVDGVADDIGGAPLTFGSFRHGQKSPGDTDAKGHRWRRLLPLPAAKTETQQMPL